MDWLVSEQQQRVVAGATVAWVEARVAEAAETGRLNASSAFMPASAQDTLLAATTAKVRPTRKGVGSKTDFWGHG